MRDRSLLAALAIASALLMPGCASGPGSVLTQRPDMTQAQAQMASCRAAARSSGALAACSAQHGPTLARLSRELVDQAGRAQDRATRINLYATAANAGWDSGVEAGLQSADAAIQAGGGECSRIPPTEFTPARDCALLSVGPGFVAHVRTAGLADRIENRPPASVSAADKRQFTDASTRYVRNTFDFVEERRQRINADPNVDASMRTLLDRQRAVFYCTALHIATVNRKLGQAGVSRQVSRDRDRILAADPSLQGETCIAAS